MSFSEDSKINGLQMSMLTAIMDNDPAAFIRAHRAAGQIAESYLHKLPDRKTVVLTDEIPVFPFPEWMGLKGVGFRATEPFLVAAMTGNGKSMFLGNLAAYLIRAKARVTILENEGRDQDYGAHVYKVIEALQPPPNNRQLSDADCYSPEIKLVINQWLKDTPALNIIDVRSFGPDQILALMTRIMSKRQTDVILFDWIGKVKVHGDQSKKYEAYSYMATKFEELCMEWKIPIGIFGQINRESIRGKQMGAPGIGSLHGCPDIENIAGLCIYLKNGLTNAGDFNGPSFLWANVAKHRAGPITERTIRVHHPSKCFYGELDPDQIEAFMDHMKTQKKRTG